MNPELYHPELYGDNADTHRGRRIYKPLLTGYNKMFTNYKTVRCPNCEHPRFQIERDMQEGRYVAMCCGCGLNIIIGDDV